MKKINGPENSSVIQTIKMLEHQSVVSKAPIWKVVAKYLKTPKRKRPSVNLMKLSKFAKEGAILLVPGRVLSMGTVPAHSFTIACDSSSLQTRTKLEKSKVKLISIATLVSSNPKGSNVKIIV